MEDAIRKVGKKEAEQLFLKYDRQGAIDRAMARKRRMPPKSADDPPANSRLHGQAHGT